MTRTIGGILEENGGIGPGFNTLRVALALAIVIFHSLDVTQGVNASTGIAWLVTESLLPMFFALSGFLITASAQRLPIQEFLLNRGFRIFPALFVEIALSAIVLGAIATTIPLRDYYPSPEVGAYFLNVVGLIHYFLPGVFVGHPHAGMVNASLWTIPWELLSYFIMLILIISSLIRRPHFVVIIAGAAILLPVLLHLCLLLLANFPATSGSASRLLDSDLYFNGTSLDLGAMSPKQVAYWLIATLTGWQFRVIPFFLAGSALYILRGRVKYSPALAMLISAGLILGGVVLPPEWDGPLLNVVLCPALVYLTMFIGVTKTPPLPLFGRGDYSYGIYLYSYPIQQMVVRSGADHLMWERNAMLSIPLITLFAMFSWHAIERPILMRRKSIAEKLRSMRLLPRLA
jgi:peptidoglycan/LPS O-acetylase OafA/YrhL